MFSAFKEKCIDRCEEDQKGCEVCVAMYTCMTDGEEGEEGEEA